MNRLPSTLSSRRVGSFASMWARRGGRALIVALAVVAALCFVAGVLAAVVLGGLPRAALRPTTAPVTAGGGGFSGTVQTTSPTRYAWLDRGQADIVARSRDAEPASSPTDTTSTGAGTTNPAGNSPGGTTGPTEPPVTQAKRVPRVVGESLQEAEQLVAAADLAMKLKARKHSRTPVGRVASQWPAAGSARPADGTVYVTKSLGPAPRKMTPRKSTTRRKKSGGGCSGDCSRCHPNR